MNDRITTDTPFGEAFNIIFHALATDKGDDFATFGLSFYRKGGIRHINARMYSETLTSKNVIEKGHAHCTWTEQFYPTACCMDINTLLEYIETGEAVKPAPRRTFLEIINALIADLNKLTEENDYGLHKINTAGTAVLWYEPIPGEITYYDITQEGEFGTDKDYTFTPAAHLSAIAAACTEIAANYAAEHGKEEA